MKEQVLTPPNFRPTVWEQRDASSSEPALQSSSPHTLPMAVSTRLLATWSLGGIEDRSVTSVRFLAGWPAYRAPLTPLSSHAVGWMNLLGQVAGVASTEFGLSRMIWAAVNVRYDGAVRTHALSSGFSN